MGRYSADRRIMGAVAAAAAAVALGACGGGDGGGSGATSGGEPVRFDRVQAVFDEYGCAGCHPGVNSSLDLREGEAYEHLVGVAALEDPSLVRVVAGDPGLSFLYLKLGGDPPVADIPAIGTRMPPGSPPIAAEDLAVVRQWILDGAQDVDGTTHGPQVVTPGTPPTDLDGPEAVETVGSGTITGTVVGQDRQPLAGAIVTLLLKGAGQSGGEEHYRAAITDAAGSFTLADAPAGQFLLKAYAPDTIYVSRIVRLDEAEAETVSFGLPDRQVDNPSISSPRVDVSDAGTALALDVQGTNLDPNYTLAVHRQTGRVVELHNEGERPGTWQAAVTERLEGEWTFLAVDRTCNVSDFVSAAG
jgi:hypothetical protein